MNNVVLIIRRFRFEPLGLKTISQLNGFCGNRANKLFHDAHPLSDLMN